MSREREQPREATNVPPLVPPSPGDTRLVKWPDTPLVRTTTFDMDAVAALQRGLKEYLEQLEADDSGAAVRFRAVHMTWAEPEQDAVYPSASVLMEGKPEYDADNLSPQLFEHDKMPDGSYVEKVSEVTVTLLIVAHCADPGERNIIARMLEIGLSPVEWMSGFWLDLPHYGGQRASYLPMRGEYRDDPTLARHGLRPLEIAIEARVSEIVPRRPPKLQPKFVAVVEDPQDPAPANTPGVPPAPLESSGPTG